MRSARRDGREAPVRRADAFLSSLTGVSSSAARRSTPERSAATRQRRGSAPRLLLLLLASSSSSSSPAGAGGAGGGGGGGRRREVQSERAEVGDALGAREEDVDVAQDRLPRWSEYLGQSFNGCHGWRAATGTAQESPQASAARAPERRARAACGRGACSQLRGVSRRVWRASEQRVEEEPVHSCGV